MDKKREQRMDRFLSILQKKYDSDVDLLDQEDLHIARLRQFVIFRDILSVVMRKMCTKNSSSLSTSHHISKGYRIVRMSLTAPVASPRQLGISMVCSFFIPFHGMLTHHFHVY
jgi:hypothetical protein